MPVLLLIMCKNLRAFSISSPVAGDASSWLPFFFWWYQTKIQDTRHPACKICLAVLAGKTRVYCRSFHQPHRTVLSGEWSWRWSGNTFLGGALVGDWLCLLTPPLGKQIMVVNEIFKTWWLKVVIEWWLNDGSLKPNLFQIRWRWDVDGGSWQPQKNCVDTPTAWTSPVKP